MQVSRLGKYLLAFNINGLTFLIAPLLSLEGCRHGMTNPRRDGRRLCTVLFLPQLQVLSSRLCKCQMSAETSQLVRGVGQFVTMLYKQNSTLLLNYISQYEIFIILQPCLNCVMQRRNFCSLIRTRLRIISEETHSFFGQIQ